ncbi:hypothetical protein BH10CYA1_BH10CYA1_41250 [soil metagenome]
MPSQLRLICTCLSQAVGAIVGLVASLIIVGWVCDIGSFKSIIPGQSAVPANSSITWALAGWSLLLISTSNRWTLIVGRVLSIIIIFAGLITLFNTLFDWGLSFDWLIFQTRDDSIPILFPGEMVIQESIPFILIGSSLLLVGTEKKELQTFCAALAVAAALPSMQALVGYGCSSPELFTFCTGNECARLHLVLALLCVVFCFALLYCAKLESKFLATAQ